MVTRENRTFLISWFALLLFVAVSIFTETSYDPIVWFVAVAIFGFVGPQLYLAITDPTVPAESRLRIGVLLTIAVAILGFSNVEPGQQRLIASLCAVLFVALLGYELLAGYRETSPAKR